MRDFTRQLGWFDPAKYQVPITIVGAGGIGGPTTLALAKLGLQKIKVYDFDTVEAHNQPNQIFGEQHLTKNKAVSLYGICRDLAFDVVDPVPSKFTYRNRPKGIVIGAVDSMDARREIWNAVVKAGTRVPLYIDGRIGGQVIRVLTVRPSNRKEVKRYEDTLVRRGAVAPMRCTEAGIIDVSFAVAALITRAVRFALVDNERVFDLYYDHRNLKFLRG